MSFFGNYFGFNLSFRLNYWTITLAIIYITFLLFGYSLISTQVKLVKKEIWKFLDKFKCFVYAIFFAGGCEIIIAMMFTFATKDNYAYTAPFILIPLCYNLILLTLYPLADFIYMASSKKELARSPPHHILEKYIINKVKSPYSYFVAILLYLLIFILPPLLIIKIGGHEFVIIWVSWQMIFPMGIITYYGSKGFITGLVNDYSRIPRLERSMFLAFENLDRAQDEFERDPMNRIMLPLRFYLYFWTIISIYFTLRGGFNTLANAFTVYLVLAFGVIGYFSRFWGRRTKFKTMDIMYAAFLISAVGINVLVNFALVNSDLLEIAFIEWDITAVINPGNARKFALAAVIEEIVLTFVVTYYLVKTLNKGFINDTIHSLITKSEEEMDPLIPFNFARSDNDEKREHAYDVLRRIYDRAPVKEDVFISSPVLKNPLFDSITDYNLYSAQIGKELLKNLIQDHPKLMVENGVIEKALQSKNFDKSIRTFKTLLENGENIYQYLDPTIFFQFLHHPEYHIQRYSVRVLRKYYESCPNEKPSDEFIAQLIKNLNIPDYEMEADILQLLLLFSDKVPPEIFSERMDHHVDSIRAIAAESAGKINVDSLDNLSIDKLIQMLESANPEIQSAVMRSLAKLGKFKENNIPIEPFIDGLFDNNVQVREGALKGALQFIEEQPEQFNYEKIVKKLKLFAEMDISSKIDKESDVYSILIQILAENYNYNFSTFYNSAVKLLKSTDFEISEIAEKVLVKTANENPELIVSNLLEEEETVSFLKKGKIAQTIINIGKNNAEVIIPQILNSLQSKDEKKEKKEIQENIKINASSVLSEMALTNPSLIDIKPLLIRWVNEQSVKVKENIEQVCINLAHEKIKDVQEFVPTLFNRIFNEDKNVRLTVSKMLSSLSKLIPLSIPLKKIEFMISDEDPFVRENAFKILKHVGGEFPKKAFKLILKGLEDESKIVQQASADGIMKLIPYIYDTKTLNEIKKLLDHPQKGIRLSALESILMIFHNDPDFLTINSIIKYLKDEDKDFRSSSTKLIAFIPIEKFDEIFPVVIELLDDPEKLVRNSIISVMVKIYNSFNSEEFIPKLMNYLNDETSIRLQRSIAQIFRKTTKYEKKAIKNRIVSMLKIRVETTQDNLLSEVLSELQDEKGSSIL